MLRGLTVEERELIAWIVKSMTRNSLRSYEQYLATDGVLLEEMADIDRTYHLSRKGWLVKNQDLFDPEPVYLTKEAWEKFSMAEWDYVDEQNREQERSNESGSW